MSAIRDRVLPLRKETLQDGVFRRLCELILEAVSYTHLTLPTKRIV